MRQILKEIQLISSSHARPMLFLSIVFALWMIVFNKTILSAINVWWVSEIYTHGFFILPISAYLVWRKRNELACLSLQPCYFVILPLLFFSSIYILGVAGDISLFQHAAIFSILPLSIWFVYGTEISKVIFFPLIFMLFSIPFGEEFIPVLQEITADISVWMLKTIGVPVFRNGLYIEIPSGRFVVAEACSGVRFFVGSAVFGAIYAYISYQSSSKRILFFAISLVLPIIANGVRVFAIILIGHLFGMEYATGADHLIYGWVFFAIVIILLVFIGSRWTDTLGSLDEKSSNKLQYLSGSYKGITVAIVLTSVIYTAIFSWALFIRNNKHEFERLAVNQSKTSQQVSDQYWSPELFGATEIRFNKFQADNEHAVDYYTAYYKFNTPSTELVSSKNRIYDPRDWTLKQKTTEKISSATNNVNALLYSVVGSNGQYRLILYWYEIGELKTYAPIWIKLYQSIDAIFGNPGSGRIVIISAVYREGELNSMKEMLFSIARDALASEKV